MEQGTQKIKEKKEDRVWKAATLFVSIVAIAVSIFIHVDTKRSTENKIVEALSERYASVDKEMSYEQALEAIDRDIQTLANDKESLQLEKNQLESKVNSLEEEIKFLEEEIDRSEKIARAESYAASGNYEVAIPTLNSIPEKTEDVVALLKDYTANYEISTVANAESLASNWNFDEALSLIDEALKIIPNSQALLDKKRDITPKYLVDTIECYKAENLWLLDSKEYIKMSGKSYRHAIYTQQSDIVGSMFNNAYSANAFYNLDGKYSQLSGIVGSIDFSGSGTIGKQDGGQVYDAEITIWGDEQEITTINLSSNDAAKDFNVLVSGVKILEFRVKCGGNSKVGIAEIQIR